MKKIDGKKKTATVTAARARQKAAFIYRLSEYLTKDQAKWSIKLEMGSEDAKTWAAMRNLTPLFGYPTHQEAVELLTQFLA